MADIVAELRSVTRTALLTEALEDRLEDVLADETFRAELRSAYFDGDLDREAVVTLLGEDEAVRMDLLARLLDQEVPDPAAERDIPTDEEFYGREPPSVTRTRTNPDEGTDRTSG